MRPVDTTRTAQAENDRVHEHFVKVEALVGSRDVRGLDPQRRLARALLLDELAHYRRARRFPLNREFRQKAVPCFIDEVGTRCAVAHLLEVSGQGELAESFARRRTYARVHELADDERIVAWLDAAGLTLEEAARIQPEYCFVSVAAVCLCNYFNATVAEGVVVSPAPDPSTYQMNVRIERIDGAPTSFMVGDVIPAFVHESQGTRVLLTVGPSNPTGTYEVGENNVVSDSTVTCNFDDITRANPIPKDVARQALTAGDKTSCQNVLTTQDPSWSRSQCDRAPEKPAAPPGAPAASGWSCGIDPHGAPSSGGALTTAGVLAALFGYRSKRRRRKPPF